jgi:hypothetical protein
MKAFYTLILVLLAGTAFGQRNLPACPALDNSQTGVNKTQNWNNCTGNYADEDGRFAYQGEYQNGVPNGYGSETFSDGNKYFGELKNGWRNGHIDKQRQVVGHDPQITQQTVHVFAVPEL